WRWTVWTTTWTWGSATPGHEDPSRWWKATRPRPDPGCTGWNAPTWATGCCGCDAQATGSTSFSSPRSPTTGPTTPSTTSSPPRTPRHRLCDGSWWNTTGATCAGHWPT